MKTIYYLALAAACFSMASCSNSDEPSAPQMTDNDWISPDGQVVIQLGGKDAAGASSIITRSPILDDRSNFFYDEGSIPAEANTMGIYALAPQNQWNNTAISPLLLNNVQAVGTKTPKNKADGAQDDGLNKITLKTSGSESWGGIYYYPMVSQCNYTFYGYTPYQSTGATMSTTNTKVTFSAFDGSQDIMYATASAPTIGTGKIWINSNYDENTSQLTGYNAKYIRQLKYHYELNEGSIPAGKVKKSEEHPWIPNLHFSHKLAWLKFAVIVASEQSSGDKENAKKLKVKDIRIKGHAKKATLDILTGDLDFPTASNDDYLAMKNVTGTDGNYTYTNADASDEYNPENGTATVRGYLLVNPAQTYTVELTVVPPPNEAGVTPPEQTFTVTLVQTGGEAFEAGKSYLIKLGIYAMQEVEATASVTPWGTDTEFEFPVE